MKKILLIFAILPFIIYSQNVGINTDSPQATLDVVASSDDTDYDGLIIPRVDSLDNSVTVAQDGLLVFLTADWNDGIQIWARGFYYYDNSTGYSKIWTSTNHTNPNTFGDIKTGLQTSDHDGWYLLDGRLTSTLSSNAQVASNSLGFTTNIPDASGKVLMQNNTPGTTGGNSGNEVGIGQTNLPNVNFTGNTNSTGLHNHSASSSTNGNHNHSASSSTTGNHNHSGTANAGGAHTHNFYTANHDSNSASSQGYPAGNNHIAFRTTDRRQRTENSGTIRNTNTAHTHSLTINNNGLHTHSISVNNNGNHSHSITVNNNGNHNHTATVSSGGSNTPIDITPEFLGVNVFIYLGQ